MIRKLLLAALLIFSCFILFDNLGKPMLDNWDEAWYAQMAKEMVQTGNFIVLRWNYQPLLDKPPLYIWLLSLTSLIFGFTEFSMRLISAISAVIIIMYVMFTSYKRWGFVPAVVAYATLVFNHLFIWRARSGNIDIFATLLFLIAYALIIGNYKKRHLLLGIVLGCIYLTKLSLVAFPAVIYILHELLFNRKNIRVKIQNIIVCFGIAFIISGLWLFLGNLSYGPEFVRYYLFYTDQRLFGSFTFQTKYLYHAYYALQRRFFFLFGTGVLFLIQKINDASGFVLLFFSVTLLIALSFAQKDNNWYLLPSMPFWSLTAAYATYRLLALVKNSPVFNIPVLLVVGFLSYRTYSVNIVAIMNTSSAHDQAESAVKLTSLTTESEVVVRLDHLYPSTVYYSGRKILASPEDSETKQYWISRNDLRNAIREGRISWITGTQEDTATFLSGNQDLKLELIPVNDTESLIHAMP